MIAKTKLFFFSLAIAAILGNAAYTAYTIVDAKAVGQNTAFDQLSRWKAEYDSLRPFQVQWEQQIQPASQVEDLYSILKIAALDTYGFTVDTATLIVTKIESVIAADSTPLQTDRVCLASAGQSGIVVTADNIYPTLITGLNQLAKRKDVEIASITFSTTNTNRGTATFQLCIRLRR